MGRHLDSEGCWNARDLGGLPAGDGRRIRPGALIRSESLHLLTAAGWAAVEAAGVRTIVDLRNSDQRQAEPQAPPASIQTVFVPLEEGLDDDPEFHGWVESRLLCTPVYYSRFVQCWADRLATAVAAVAQARPGAVLVHCGKGCDRTGLVILLVLAAVGVPPEAIAADYDLTAERLATPRAAALGHADDAATIQAVMEREGTTVGAAIVDLLRSVDLVGSLGASRLSDADLAALRRLLTRA